MTARLLLVHSPLVGAGTWDLVAADLAGRGWQVDLPDLTGTLEAGPPYCAPQAGVIARCASGRPAILVGHSGAGPLLAAAGALSGQGCLPPWSQWWGEDALAGLIEDPAARRRFAAGCLPLAMFEEVHPPVPQWPDAPGAYLQLSEAYQDQAAMAAELGWPVAERLSHHLAPLTDPAMVAGTLHGLLGQLALT